MKFLLPAILLIASAVADVSHLQNTYLPPVGQEHPQHHQHTEQFPPFTGANAYTPQHLTEPSNSLVPEASQTDYELPSLQPEDLRVEPEHSESASTQYHQQVSFQSPVEQPHAFQFNAVEEHQPAAQEFVPQTYGPSIFYSRVPDQGPFGLVGQPAEQTYETAASSSSGVDTQYGSNGGYVY